MGNLAMAHPAAPNRRTRHGIGAVLAHSVYRAFAALARWMERGRQRRHLQNLDDRLLCDVGLTRRDVERECVKPFWQP
jgi:uncharacterized protein YjiS (DUF1127 family)